MRDELEQVKDALRGIIITISLVLILLGVAILFSSCTLSVIMNHTEGTASDVVDSEPKSEATPHLQLSIPSIP